jgi:hypothetical protein
MVSQAPQSVPDVTLAVEPLVVVEIHAKDKLRQEKI